MREEKARFGNLASGERFVRVGNRSVFAGGVFAGVFLRIAGVFPQFPPSYKRTECLSENV